MTTKKYSQRLKDAIYRMIIMDPNKRADAKEVMELAEKELNLIKNTLKIDKMFVMEDSYFKLGLMDYDKWFLKPLKLTPVNKTFFVNEEEDLKKSDKFEYFYLLAHWLLDVINVKKLLTKFD